MVSSAGSLQSSIVDVSPVRPAKLIEAERSGSPFSDHYASPPALAPITDGEGLSHLQTRLLTDLAFLASSLSARDDRLRELSDELGAAHDAHRDTQRALGAAHGQISAAERRADEAESTARDAEALAAEAATRLADAEARMREAQQLAEQAHRHKLEADAWAEAAEARAHEAEQRAQKAEEEARRRPTGERRSSAGSPVDVEAGHSGEEQIRGSWAGRKREIVGESDPRFAGWLGFALGYVTRAILGK
ncbi:hypothetical protein PUNSTDRAFT_136235 [Punctularia strigosozonata HHB-11173 SS5]|uniref:uncharacterized protein n=1 Tax=Punctularia strigosozonata (strain HHB-11173) TaxID=741275 RepID=UPI0004417C6E|nr:uncharacterized protein PUNSTDRAFT_136235 [Punctularia strigosozonata HHB-11173 SS5]EIN06370.1 hypothetical protein PUNSTDRAFT_136235 [Punctularia strigosozonata HHB-11173 SS5]